MSDETRPSNRPATFREVFGQREYRAVLAASALSWLGDYISKAAVTVIVYQESRSVALSAAAFAISYLPWLVGGPLLATLAERYPYRNVMVVCDLVRMALIALIVIPGVPVPVMLVILFVATLANPPSQAARSALMPLILPGDRLVVGLSLNNSTGQAAQVAGYAIGAGIAAFNPRAAIVLDATTFLASALLIGFGTRHRPPAMRSADRSNLLRETGQGFRLVFGNRVLRGVALLVFSAMLFSIVPEGLAAAWAQEKAEGTTAGAYQALIMAANPVGFIVGGLAMARLVPPHLRRVLVRPFAVFAPLVLVPALLNPSPLWVAVLAASSGFAVAGLMPVANGLFVQALPHGYRARAFGVMATGVQLMQGAAVLVTGLLAERFEIPLVVGVWSIGGVLLMLVMAGSWPTAHQFDVAIAEAAKSHPEAAEAPPAQRGASAHRPAHAQP
ncbi:putative MFS family arabinose efflux permease [Asanoa ferruginea]|uniref:Putative MFS family arabinose efflux permease n=1 Tax=Asanoa ferruginea TaxID=53367 RepID=A0A3D9ZD19_9ACTN|nr:putative MFS family arabinose efflux permease [Asanoa ferruginea]GIF51088.1 MFS transporter [Asanoa ferruginea]